MSGDTVAVLAGAALGALVTIVTAYLGAILTPRLTARLSRQRFHEELDSHRLEEAAAVMDDAGAALDTFHWTLQRATEALSEPVGGKRREHWREKLADARSEASVFGSRLSIRLGTAGASRVVEAYVHLQRQYDDLAACLFDSEITQTAREDVSEKLSGLRDHDRYFKAACQERAESEMRLRAQT